MNTATSRMRLAAISLAISVLTACQRAPDSAHAVGAAGQEPRAQQATTPGAAPATPPGPSAKTLPRAAPPGTVSRADSADVARMKRDLTQILSRPLKLYEEILLVRRVRDSGRKDVVPALIEVARVCSRDPARRQVGMEALHAAAELEDIRDQLEKFALDYRGNPGLAAHAILILARDPGPRTMGIVTKMLADEAERVVRDALTEAKRVRGVADRFASIQDPRAKADYVLAHFGCDRGNAESYDLKTEPYKWWSQRELRRLSEEFPNIVAQAVFLFRRYDEPAKSGDVFRRKNRELNEYVASRFLSEKAKSEFDRLNRRQSETDRQKERHPDGVPSPK